jgi:EmrB/QacA subfamily drug resistance transporter
MYRLRWVTLAVVCVSLMVITIDNTILNVALPTLGRQLGAGTSSLQWIVDIYVLVFAGLLLTAGSLGDRFGRYKALTFGLVVFGIGSVASALSGSTNVLISTRAFMGIGGAFIMPATLSIITNVFTNPLERGKAIGIWAGVAALGVGIGPVTGGFLLAHFYWGSVFFVNVPIVILALIGGWFLIPESKDPSAPPLDPIGALLSILGLAALLWAVIEAPLQGWGSPSTIAGLVASVVLLAAFVRWEFTYSSPMLDMRFFKNPRFTAASGAIALAFFSLFGALFVLTQYLQLVHGYSPLRAGALLVPQSAAMMVTAASSSAVVQRWGNKVVVGVGLLVVAAGLGAFAGMSATAPLWEIIVATVVMGIGFGNVMAPATDSIMGSLPRAKAGVGSAMNDTTRQTGGAIGVAVIGSVLASKFRSSMVSGGRARHLPSAVISATRSDIATALRVAKTPLGKPVAPVIVSLARSSFVASFHVAALVGTAVIVVAALCVFRWLPARPPEEAPSGNRVPAGAHVAAESGGLAASRGDVGEGEGDGGPARDGDGGPAGSGGDVGEGDGGPARDGDGGPAADGDGGPAADGAVLEGHPIAVAASDVLVDGHDVVAPQEVDGT